jgi:hypothetical protein
VFTSHKIKEFLEQLSNYQLFKETFSRSALFWDSTQLIIVMPCRSQWPCGLRRRSSASRLLRLWVRIPPATWMSVWCDCCVLSCRGLCDELITRPVESYRLWCLVLCDIETSWKRRPWPTGGCRAKNKKNNSNSLPKLQGKLSVSSSKGQEFPTFL